MAQEWLHRRRAAVVRYEGPPSDPFGGQRRLTDEPAPVAPERIECTIRDRGTGHMRQRSTASAKHVRAANVGITRDHLTEEHCVIVRNQHAATNGDRRPASHAGGVRLTAGRRLGPGVRCRLPFRSDGHRQSNDRRRAHRARGATRWVVVPRRGCLGWRTRSVPGTEPRQAGAGPCRDESRRIPGPCPISRTSERSNRAGPRSPRSRSSRCRTRPCGIPCSCRTSAGFRR